MAVSEDRLRVLVECLISLAVRSPMSREAAVSLAERFRGSLKGRERNALIGLNMRHCLRMVCDAIGSRGKFAVLYSGKREFIFGAGFFHSMTSPSAPPMEPRILAPLTPEISVLHAIPSGYRPAPRMVTQELTDDEVLVRNDTVLVYSRNEVFFRSQKPPITDNFAVATHLRFSEPDHLIEQMIHKLSGVARMDGALSKMLARFGR